MSIHQAPLMRDKASRLARITLALLASFCGLFITLQTATASELPTEGAHISILESSDQQIVVELIVDDYAVATLDLPDAKLNGTTINGSSLQRVEIAGRGFVEAAGAPQVPVAGAMLGVPTTAGLSVQVLEADYETLAGLKIAPAPRYVAASLTPALDLADVGTESLQTVYEADAAIYEQDAWYPQTPAQLGMSGALRDQAVAQIQFAPVQYNPVTQEARVYRRIVAQVSWTPQVAAAQVSSRAASAAFEPVLAETLLNYENLVRPQPQQASSPAVTMASVDAVEASPQVLKIYVNEDGLYQLTHDDLANAGLNPASVDPRNLKLSLQGVEVPIYVSGQGDGAFDPADYLLFYGKAITDVYTSENVYWLSEGNSAGQRMTQRNGAPGGAGAVPSRFRTLIHAEENTLWWRFMPFGEGKDHWFWFEPISPSTGGMPTFRDFTIPLANISTQPGTAIIRVQLRGYTALKHRTKIYLNGTAIDDKAWEGQIIFNQEVEVDHALLQSGNNVIRVESLETGAAVDQYFVNWIEIEYFDSYTADGNQLPFQAPAAGTYNFEIAGFSAANLFAFDITNPAAPQMIVNGVAAPNGSTTTFKLRDTATAATRYLALDLAQAKTPVKIVLEQPSTWKQASNGADYILITHEDFYTATLPLAQHRTDAGMRVAVVKVGDLYDEFNGGVFNPKAIRDFLSYAYQNWQAPAPAYVFLVGDADLDYHDYRNTGTVNYVPTQFVDTDSFQAASDSWFAAISGADILPDLFIGRLSAQTVTQVNDVIAKIIAYDQKPDEEWNKEILLVADDRSSAFTFQS